MDTDNEYFPSAGLDGPDEPSFTSNGGSIFPHAHHFTVAGGTFTTNSYPAAPAVPPDFRMIPWGDIDLQQGLLVNPKSGAIGRRNQRNCVRRVYSAKVDGGRSDFTVAVYQGGGAEEDWCRDVARYMSMRHPNIVQICAGASYGNLHATVFHGDLVPFRQYIAGRSPMSTVYLHGLYLSEWRQVSSYFDSMFLRETYSDEFTIWIRSSSGQLCADFTNPSLHDTVYLWESPYDLIPDLHGPTVFDAKNDETLAIHCLSLEQYHAICGHRLAQGRSSFVYTTATSFTPGTVVSWPMPPASEDLRDVGHEIAFLPDVPCECSGWIVFGEGGVENLMENGWMRYEYNEAFNTPILLAVGTSQLAECWLAQANYVFSSLHLESNLENYVLVAAVEFTVIVPDQMVDCPPGYLFFCPGEDFQVGTSSCKWPDNPAYWSLGPSGVERLSVEEATRRGFPPLELTTEVQRRSWDASIYAGLRQFHRAKGFDPKSQDVARHLGLPLFQLSGNVDPPFAHVERYGEEHDDGDRDKAEGSQGNDGEDSKLKATDKNGDRANVETNGQDEREVEGTEGNGLRTDDPPLEDSSSPSDAGQIPLAGGSGTSQIRVSQDYADENDTSSHPRLHAIEGDEDIPVTLKILLNTQLALMLFLAMCWLYDNW